MPSEDFNRRVRNIFSSGYHWVCDVFSAVKGNVKSSPSFRAEENRWKAERKLGRRLRAGEVVHHQNKIKTDNRYGNLEVFKSRKAHQAHHIKKAWTRTRRRRTLKGR